MPERFSEVLKQGCNMSIPDEDCQKSPCICTIVKVKSLKVVLDSEIGQNSMQNLHFRA